MTKNALVLVLFPALACFAPDRLEGETAIDSSGGSTAASSDGDGSMATSVTSAGTGDEEGCMDASACDDDNPCSSDRCEDGACVHEPVVDDPSCVCTGPGDCEQFPADDECRTRTCDAGVCGLQFADAGTPLGEAAQSAEDCRQVVCDGRGGTQSVVDDTDVPDDGRECTDDACADGMPASTPVDRGTPCAAGTCDAVGQCTGCTGPGDCGGQDSFCQQVTCEASICGIAVTDSGTPLPDGEQTTGDCLRRVCDGKGNLAMIADDNDLPGDDGSECTDETCNAGVADHPALPADEPCSGGVCNGDGACVECNANEQCPAAGACTVGVCTAGVCGVAFAEAGTGCNDGLFCTASDACDGGGTCVGSGSPCPGADGDSDCSETCNEGADACTGNDGAGTACNDGLFCTQTDTCNGAGTCVGAGNPCPGADGDSDCSETCSEAADACTGIDPGGSDCGACRMCSNGVCGGSFCTVGEKCCPGDDECVPTQAQCP